MKNLPIILGFVLIGAYIVKRNKATAPASGTPQTITDNGTIDNPNVTYQDVVATMEVNPGWVPHPFSPEWNAVFPHGTQNLNLGLEGAWTIDNL